jgi:hypothetical protein
MVINCQSPARAARADVNHSRVGLFLTCVKWLGHGYYASEGMGCGKD